MHVFRRLTKMVTDFGAVYVTWEDSGAMRLENTSYRMQAEQGVQCQNESRETMPVPSEKRANGSKHQLGSEHQPSRKPGRKTAMT